MATILAAGGQPTLHDLWWIALAITTGRAAAMAMDNLADLKYDSQQPRMGYRAMVKGEISRREAKIFIVICLILMVLAAGYAYRDRLINDLLLGVAVLVLLGTLVQAGVGLARMSAIDDESELATFVAYALTLPFVPLITTFLAIKDKSRWAMGSIAVGAFAVLVMTIRLQQIWNVYA